MQQWEIEVSEKMYEVIVDLFKYAGLPIPYNVTSNDMEQVAKKMKLIASSSLREKNLEKFIVVNDKIKKLKSIKSALIISDLGIIRYQLKIMFNNNHIEAKTVESYYNGLAEYIKNLHDVVIIDVSGKTNDATRIIDEIKKFAKKNAVKTDIIVLSTSAETKEKNFFLKLGISKFIQKVGNWYYEIEQEIKKNSLVPA
ncbi:MAG: response regulator [Cyanobacteriota bacterium]